MEPEQALAFFLNQLLYDVNDDATGVGSGLRGHSLARNMYGYNYSSTSGTATNGSPIIVTSSTAGFNVNDFVTVTLDSNPNDTLSNQIMAITPNVNITLRASWNYPTGAVTIKKNLGSSVPYNGVGRLHYPGPNPWGLPQPLDDYTLVNYTYFAADRFLRDPERYGTRTAAHLEANIQPNHYVAGNVSYTYPDLNNFFLGAIKADGTLITPSYHRKWLFNANYAFNDMSNPNWTNQVGKYLTVRPRPKEHPNFPAPDDATGDVKNLIGAPGGNDSIWIDIGAPVMTAPDGTKYKMLVAPLILDLDNRINVNTAGNILGPNNSHLSHQGWGPWEVNLAKVLFGDSTANPQEYKNLFVGDGRNWGKYGPDQLPAKANSSAPYRGMPNHFYSQIDYNARNETNPARPSSLIQPPGFGTTPAFSLWPTYAQGYNNANSLDGPLNELKNHPALYNGSQNDDRVFRVSDMEGLLRPNSLGKAEQRLPDTGSSALISDLARLSPSNFGPDAVSPRFRNLVTTLSMDFGNRSGIIPYWYTTPDNTYTSAADPTQAPIGSAIPFPPLPPSATPSSGPSEFGTDWRSTAASYNRLNPGSLSFLSYPHQATGAAQVSFNDRFDNKDKDKSAVVSQFYSAQSNRQNYAGSIYQRLLNVTGVGLPANPAEPAFNDPNFIARRWLAQLAVNIVDYLDEDDISTPFNFY
jgi:hypothetical protein